MFRETLAQSLDDSMIKPCSGGVDGHSLACVDGMFDKRSGAMRTSASMWALLMAGLLLLVYDNNVNK